MRENGHAYSPETLFEAVARGGSTAGHESHLRLCRTGVGWGPYFPVSRGDHGGTGVGGCDAKSGSPARGDLFVVMGPIATQERRDGTNHDIRERGRASRQAHLAQQSRRLWAASREEPDDLTGAPPMEHVMPSPKAWPTMTCLS